MTDLHSGSDCDWFFLASSFHKCSMTLTRDLLFCVVLTDSGPKTTSKRWNQRLTTERDNLKTTVRTLKTTIVSAHLPLPPGIDSPETTAVPPPVSQYDMPAAISYGLDDFNNTRLHVSWPSPSQPPAPAYSEHVFGSQPQPQQQQYSNQSWFAESKPLPNIPHGRHNYFPG